MNDSITVVSYPKFLKDEHERGVKMGCLGDVCFVAGCNVKSPLYPVGDARFWCGMCIKHARMKLRYRNYFESKIKELQTLLYLGAVECDDDKQV